MNHRVRIAMAICSAIAVTALASKGARAERKKTEAPKMTKLMTFQFRLTPIHTEHVEIKDIPDDVRQVHAYRSEETTLLPKHTSGGANAIFTSFGIGLNALNRVELSADFVWRSSFSGGNTTLNQVEFPTDNYVGYQYIGPSIMLGISGRVLYGLYLTTGYAFNWTRLESGTDAFDEFHVQHSVNIPDSTVWGIACSLRSRTTRACSTSR